METFFDYLKSPSWWLTVVVVGIAINVISAYLKWIMDLFLERWSVKYRAWSESGRKRQTDYINFLRNNPEEQFIAFHREARYRIRSSLFLLSGLILFLGGLEFMNGAQGMLLLAHIASESKHIDTASTLMRNAWHIMISGLIVLLLGLSDYWAAMKEESAIRYARSTGKRKDPSS